MKRLGNCYEEVCSLSNINAAYHEAKKDKSRYREVKWIEANKNSMIAKVKHLLETELYSVSEYTHVSRVEGGKLRNISKLPFYPDRIVHHALLRVIGLHIRKSFIRDTFQSIKGRGTSDTRKRIVRFIDNHQPKYFLQMDIKKYYPSINHQYLKRQLQRKVKCKKTLNLLDVIIDSHKGLPIGNYTSQDLGNLYLTPFDWFVKQELGIKGYFRYCDDLVLLSENKDELYRASKSIIEYMTTIHLKIKPDYNVTDLEEGLDFVGYVFFPNGIKLREKIYKSAEHSYLNRLLLSMSSYYGWLKPTKDNRLKRLYENIYKRNKT